MFISALLGPRGIGKTTLVNHYIKTHSERQWIQFNMDERKQRQRIELLRLREFNLREITQLLNKKISLKYESAFHLIFNSKNFESLKELYSTLRPFHKLFTNALDQQLIWGGLPEALESDTEQDRLKYLSNYLQTYLEKDIREISSIGDLTLYENLMKILAELTGSVRDDQKIINALHCSRNTLHKYQGYLMASWQYFEIEPFIGNTIKRLVKSPKGYLKNNGLISYFTGIKDLLVLSKTGLIGHRFENWFLNELNSYLDNIHDYHNIYFWRTHSGQEVDFIVQVGQQIIPFEVTYSSQPLSKKIRNLKAFIEDNPKVSYAVYLYQGPLNYDENNKILFLPAWMV